MAKQIYDTKQFPFPKVDLGKPFNKNGVHFIKMYVNESPIFIQPPKCMLKQGILKTGKKLFCDLVFPVEEESVLGWLDKIEEIAKTKIFENRTNWFETELDEHDIESSMVSPYKMYKSGKYFIIRTDIPTNLGKCDLKIYDDNEMEIPYEEIKENAEVITIIELKGIKCSARSFQFVFDVRQMMVVSPSNPFEKCIINKNTPNYTPRDSAILETPTPKIGEFNESGEIKKLPEAARPWNQPTSQPPFSQTSSHISNRENTEIPAETKHNTYLYTKTSAEIFRGDNDLANSPEVGYAKNGTAKRGTVMPTPTEYPLQPNTNKANIPAESRIPNEGTHVATRGNSELCEIDLNLDGIDQTETVSLKPRNDVYYKLYKDVKRKAKEAKMIALSNYLEAKRLKTTYGLEDSSDSSDYDSETEYENADV
jgi:hypothetical protein